MKNHRLNTVPTLLAGLIFLYDAGGYCVAQRMVPAPIAPEWRGLSAKVHKVLCPDEPGAGIVETADVTGDGVSEALVEYCRMGAYTSDFLVMRLEKGTPVVAKFRDKSGRAVPVSFMRGSSVRNSEDVTLLPEKHAVYATHRHTDDSGASESCEVEAYVWSERTKTFDENEPLSQELAKSDCGNAGREIDTLEAPRALLTPSASPNQ